MADTFSYKHKNGSQGSITLRTREAQFGDGYLQAVKDGLNNRIASWNLTFEGNFDEISPIITFFDNKGGATAFNWTAPDSTKAKLWRVKTYTVTRDGALYSVSAEFIQYFVP